MKSNGILALIPAKGASTRLPRKNIIDFAGTSLLARAVQSARESGLCSDILVSSEDDEILAKAAELGVKTLRRPDFLSIDPSGIVDVALHVLEHLETTQNLSYETLFILAPTCPLREADDVKNAYQLYRENNGKFLMSVTEYHHSPYSAWSVDEMNRAAPVFPELCVRRQQELAKAYRCNGAIHIVDVAAFKLERSYTAGPLLSYVMPRERSFDIDTAHDFWEAEAYYKQFVLNSECD